MERITYRITLDTKKAGIQKMLQGFETADNMSRRIAVNLVSGSDTFEILSNNIIAMVYVTTPNATEPSINGCVIEDNTIIYDMLPVVVEGITEMQIKLIETSLDGAKKVLVSPKFAIEVTESGTDDSGAEQTTTFTALEDALAKANAVHESRLVKVEITDDCMFRAFYADGTVYENDYLKEALYNGNALLAESFAHGNTGVREGENTDNAMYYSNISKSASVDANSISAETRVLLDEVTLRTIYTMFNVDFENGELRYLTSNYTFDINEEEGTLEVTGEAGYNPEQIISPVVDAFIEEKSEELDDRIDTATNIAKGKNQARVFNTTDEMYAWLSDSENAHICCVGDNLYITEVEVPDWWVSEVLTEPNEQGMYYNIAQLETQKVDLIPIEEAIEENKEAIEEVNSNLDVSLVNRGNIFNLGLDDIATAPVGIYSTGNNSEAKYGISTYSYVFKPNANSFNGAYYIRYTTGSTQDSMYIYRNSLGKFERIPTQDDLSALQYDIGASNEKPIGLTRIGKDVYSIFKNVTSLSNASWTDILLTDILPSDISLAWIDVANSFLYADGVTYPINFKTNDKFISVYLKNTQRKAVVFNSWLDGNLCLCIRYTK